MENRGTIIACDRDPERLQILKDNMARLGVEHCPCCSITIGRAIASRTEIASMAPFDRILIDAPCTNTGVMRTTRGCQVAIATEPISLACSNEQFEIIRALYPAY